MEYIKAHNLQDPKDKAPSSPTTSCAPCLAKTAQACSSWRAFWATTWAATHDAAGLRIGPGRCAQRWPVRRLRGHALGRGDASGPLYKRSSSSSGNRAPRQRCDGRAVAAAVSPSMARLTWA